MTTLHRHKAPAIENVVVVGASGFIGSEFVRRLISEGRSVTTMSRRTDADAPVKNHVTLTGEPGLDEALFVRNFHGQDAIINCIGSPTVATSYTDPYRDFVSSVAYNEAILSAMWKLRSGAIAVYLSSPAVIARSDDLLLREDSHGAPHSPYGAHKAMAEEYISFARAEFGLSILVLRLFSVYGPNLRKQLLYDACKKITEDAHPVFHGTGEDTRDFVHVEDVYDAMLSCLESVPLPELVHVGTGVCTNTRTVIEMIRDGLRKTTTIDFRVAPRAGDPIALCSDISVLRSLGWSPTIDLCRGVREYCRWFQNDAQ